MNTKKSQFIKGFLAFAVTLAILFAGQIAWMDYMVKSPLDKTLKNIDGVSQVALINSKKFNEPVIINVTLDGKVNLAKTYSEINEKIVQILKKKPYVLKISDNRTPELEELYYDISYYVQKAIFDGNFPLLVQNVKEKAKAADADVRIYVDNKNVYLQFTKNNNSLYAIESRQSGRSGGDI